MNFPYRVVWIENKISALGSKVSRTNSMWGIIKMQSDILASTQRRTKKLHQLLPTSTTVA
jgi:hypothetical protein